MCCLVNGFVASLHSVLKVHSAEVAPVFASSPEGRSIYRRSLCFAMIVTANEEFGKDPLLIAERPISVESHAGYVISLNRGDTQVTDEFISRLTARLNNVISRNLPITEVTLGYRDAVQYFEKMNKPYSRALIEATNSDHVRLFQCAGHFAPFIRSLCASTGVLTGWTCRALPDRSAFVLLFPPAAGGAEVISDPMEDPITSKVCKDYTAWVKLLGAECVGDLNKKIIENGSRDLVLMSEALHNQKIVEIAQNIHRIRSTLRLVLIAGPSASGKTTFAAKLTTQLRILGFQPVTLSIDNYYKPRKECVDENGVYDFERLQALRVDVLNDHLARIMAGETVNTPIFDFHTGFPKEDKFITVKLPANGIIVMEGILCTNDALTPRIPRENKYKIFLAPLSQVNLDECNFPSHSVHRLVRRINRDYNHRGYSARATLSRWGPVSKSEEKNILPYMKHADVVFNTALPYETCVLHPLVMPLLRTVKPWSQEYNDARSLLQILGYFFPIQPTFIPADSLLREFSGGSIFED